MRVFYTTPPYFDYNWTVRADMTRPLREEAHRSLPRRSTRPRREGKEILDLQRATQFIPTKAENYKGIETAARNAGLLK